MDHQQHGAGLFIPGRIGDKLMKLLYKVGLWIYTLVIPIYLLMTIIRIFISPAYAVFEYNRPYFPEDTYGFSQTERLKWATYGIEFLTNNEDINYLGDLKFEDGDPLFIESELSHMQDVKQVVKGMLIAWNILSVFLLLFIALSIFGKQRKALFMASSVGGWISVILVAGILFFLSLDFDALFTAFHHIFFSGNSWLFSYSDTLIRLYPIVFWRDVFIYIMSGNMLIGLLMGFFCGRAAKKIQS
jgi:integral membrane protein (TIGR01906 family)